MARGLTTLAACCLLAACASSPQVAGLPPASSAGAGVGELLALDTAAAQAYDAGSFADAAEQYMELVRQRPHDAAYWYRLANALVRTGALDDAAVAYQQVLVLDQGNDKAWHNLGVVRLQQAQAALAQAVKRADAGGEVFEDSLKLSTGLYTLVKPAIEATPRPPAESGPATTPGGAP